MSSAGIHSNRGDGYQTMVAFDWALTVISDPKFDWIEIDSTTYSVDDVVVGRSDGTLIACQCKKNQSDFRAWSISDLAEELDKASRLLGDYPNAEVRFYSRSNFGDLAKLKEHSSTQSSEIGYQTSLSKENQETDAALMARLSASASGISSYRFIRRITFVTSEDLGRMADKLRERLQSMASNLESAFNALWIHLDQLGARMEGSSTSAPRHRLTKDDLMGILRGAGAMLVAPMELAEVRLSFAGTSAIGRSWRRDIAGRSIVNPIVNELLGAIESKKRAILLTGLPGSGKTCVMLSLQEVLEQKAQSDSDISPIFIQSREFADLATAQDRESQGLPEQWVEKAARLAEKYHVVVVMDSLDVLSIARDHRVLSYFLAQIDRLLMVPNVTVVAACREFDRHYDRRIAERKWDCEFVCKPLDWDAEVAPLLVALEIATDSIGEVTRSLIKNPRELALFVELAQREGSFNVVTSQALAQRYLDNVVRANPALGEVAIQSIEAMALDMLNSRNLAVPHQRFAASQEIRRLLCSLNVIQESRDGMLTFGHQTLLDVLVISGAVRSGVTLSGFIKGLPPVPFVRPSIRSFVAQLALGERREFRRQLRTVLTGADAFHIRRLVAESFAEQTPQDDDWSLIRELREKHREVFQVIYGATAIEWHYFWVKHLVPDLRIARDSDGMARHVYLISQWANADARGVLALWREALSLDWLQDNGLSERIAFNLSKFESDDSALMVPIIERLLEGPRSEYSSLGKVIARCVSAGAIDDILLWRYISDGVSEDSLLDFRFDKKLRCDYHEFGGREENFIHQRMQQSTVLLDLALNSIERWSDVYEHRYRETRIGYRYGFLNHTSYETTHSQRDMRFVGSMDVLLDAIEMAIINHARMDSDWWRTNRERLCLSREGSLIYFAVRACTESPDVNLDLIGHMLCDKNLLEFVLNYELGTLMNVAYASLDAVRQDEILAKVLTIWSEDETESSGYSWVLEKRANLIAAIPCNQRSPEAQAVLDDQERISGRLIRQPDIRSRSGVVAPPFSYDVFLSSSNSTVLKLLSQYDGYQRNSDDFLVGGEREVGRQLQEASSRHPSRFLEILHDCWANIPSRFRDDIMDGVATYLAHRYGNLHASDAWKPIEKQDSSALINLVLDELDRHPIHWSRNRSAAKALEACSNVICDTDRAARLVFLAIGFEGMLEEDPIKGDDVGLIAKGINMIKGDVTDALMILATNLHEHGRDYPELLVPTLRRFSDDENPAIRSLILRRLPYLQSKDFDLGWDLFYRAMQDAERLWEIAEPCLYYAYHSRFDIVGPLLTRLRGEGRGKDLETYGRISALAAMDRHIDFSEFLKELVTLGNAKAWRGAATVWANVENFRQHQEQCLIGLHAGLNSELAHAKSVAAQMRHLFSEKSAVISVPLDLIRCYFHVIENDKDTERGRDIPFGFHEWLNAVSQRDPELALAATEAYLAYVISCHPHIYNHDNCLTQLMTRLFSEAEEREESDSGAMLNRVVIAQDMLLALGVNGVADWLKAAERPS